MENNSWAITEGDGPLVAAAIHSGHAVRDEIADLLALDHDERLREEDPFTDQWARVAAKSERVDRSPRWTGDCFGP